MRNIILTITAAVFLSCQAQKEDFSAEALSETLIAADGSEVTFKEILERHKGKTTLIEVWASWCGDCVKSMPDLKKTQAAHPEADYVFLSMDKTSEKWKQGIEKHGLNGDHYLVRDGMKGKFGKAAGIDWIPRYIIVDKNGKVALYRAIEKDFELINSTLQSLK